jgi:hypothetical protein
MYRTGQPSSVAERTRERATCVPIMVRKRERVELSERLMMAGDQEERLNGLRGGSFFEDALVRVRGSLLARRAACRCCSRRCLPCSLVATSHTSLHAGEGWIREVPGHASSAHQGLVGGEAVVPQVLEHARHVGAVVGQAVADLERLE